MPRQIPRSRYKSPQGELGFVTIPSLVSKDVLVARLRRLIDIPDPIGGVGFTVSPPRRASGNGGRHATGPISDRALEAPV